MASFTKSVLTNGKEKAILFVQEALCAPTPGLNIVTKIGIPITNRKQYLSV
jgi:hypothetical protein